MKRFAMTVPIVTLVACGLAGCGASSSSTSSTSPTQQAVSGFDWNNNNTDPYKGWVAKFGNEGYQTIFFRCDDRRTAYYMSYPYYAGGAVAVIPSSPDCPKR